MTFRTRSGPDNVRTRVQRSTLYAQAGSLGDALGMHTKLMASAICLLRLWWGISRDEPRCWHLLSKIADLFRLKRWSLQLRANAYGLPAPHQMGVSEQSLETAVVANGAILQATLFTPAGEKGPWPVVLIRTPYGRRGDWGQWEIASQGLSKRPDPARASVRNFRSSD